VSQGVSNKVCMGNARWRIGLLEKGREVRTPCCTTILSIRNLVLKYAPTVELGRFVSAEQAILFAVSGIVSYARITPEDVLSAERKAGFFSSFTEDQIKELFTHHRLVFRQSREKHEVTIAEDCSEELALAVGA